MESVVSNFALISQFTFPQKPLPVSHFHPYSREEEGPAKTQERLQELNIYRKEIRKQE